MEIFSDLNDKHKNLSLALGFFDGIHAGHIKVIQNAVDYANNNGLKSAVITFSEHPALSFNKNFEGYIMPPDERFIYFEKMGVDYCWVLDFNSIVNIDANDYIKNILVENFAPKAITSGFNHNFGKNKKGTSKLLKTFSKIYGYEYFEICPVIMNNITVSSSTIRKFIKLGDIENINKFMQHKFEITGNVLHGQRIGTKLGFKTANINYPKDCVKLLYGVYGVNINYKGSIYNGIANFGVKPTFYSQQEPILEIHIFDFDKEIYGEKISVEFKKFIRAEKKFRSQNELLMQIKKDIDLNK